MSRLLDGRAGYLHLYLCVWRVEFASVRQDIDKDLLVLGYVTVKFRVAQAILLVIHLYFNILFTAQQLYDFCHGFSRFVKIEHRLVGDCRPSVHLKQITAPEEAHFRSDQDRTQDLIQLIACMLLVPMPSNQLLDAPYCLIQRFDEVILNYYMKFFQRFKIALLPLDYMLRCNVAQAQQDTLFVVEEDVLSAHIDPFFTRQSWLKKAIARFVCVLLGRLLLISISLRYSSMSVEVILLGRRLKIMKVVLTIDYSSIVAT